MSVQGYKKNLPIWKNNKLQPGEIYPIHNLDILQLKINARLSFTAQLNLLFTFENRLLHSRNKISQNFGYIKLSF